jgi:Nicotinate-nucleotide pyrophosphorylase
VPKIQLSKSFIRSTCKLALNEDLYPSGDITTNLLNNNSISKVKLISNEKGIIGGLEFAIQTFNLLDRKY